jgi:hypothetical protein
VILVSRFATTRLPPRGDVRVSGRANTTSWVYQSGPRADSGIPAAASRQLNSHTLSIRNLCIAVGRTLTPPAAAAAGAAPRWCPPRSWTARAPQRTPPPPVRSSAVCAVLRGGERASAERWGGERRLAAARGSNERTPSCVCWYAR